VNLSDPLPTVVATAMLVLATLLVVVLIRYRRERQRMTTTGGRPAHVSEAAWKMQEEAAELMNRLEGLSHQFDTRMEGRLDELKGMLSEADRKIEQLRRLTEAASAKVDPQQAPAQASPAQQVHGEIRRLNSQGMDAVRIARRLGMDVGEVELVLNLQRTQAAKSP